MSTTINIPDFQYTAHFYAEILEDLTQYLRVNCPELTDEDPTEPHMQLLRGLSLSYHLNSVLLDLTANEMFLPTAKLRSSHKALLQLIDYQLDQQAPASADLLAQLSQTFTAARLVVPAKSVFSTIETRSAQAVEFEALTNASTTQRTDEVGKVCAFREDTDVYTDHTAEAITPTGTFTPTWSATPQAGDILYIGHPDILFGQINLYIGTPGSGLTGVWEYFDGNYDQGVPSSVTNLGSQLRFNVNSILGSADRSGTIVRVRSALTGAFQDLTVAYVSGENRITTSGTDSFLGQSSPSTVVTDYIVGSEWRELSNVAGPSGLTATGELAYTLPQTLEQDWNTTTVGSGGGAVTAYWLRFRIISVAAPSAPAITQIRIDEGKQYLLFTVTQGRSRTDNPLGSSDGTASQEFTFTQLPVIDDSNIVVIVNESGVDQTYTRVDNFLSSIATDRHFTLVFDDDGAAVITFGDGVNGRIPPAGVNNIRSSYRTMVDVDGNVGQNTIVVNRAGIAFLSNVTNPRGANGYTIAEGSTDEDLARVKIAGPASLRVRERAVSTQDVEVVATGFIATDGSKPVKRALAIEESYGPKTVELVVVGSGGEYVDATQLDEIEVYYNGEDGVLVMNNELTANNFTKRVVNVTLTLTGGNATSVLTALTILLNPLALNSDGTYVWEFGGTVALAKLYQVIMDTTPPPSNCAISLPAADVVMNQRELPVVGTITINGVAYVP